jgi:hypothetical protein
MLKGTSAVGEVNSDPYAIEMDLAPQKKFKGPGQARPGQGQLNPYCSPDYTICI